MTALVVDTSAMVAILRREPGTPWLRERLRAASERLIAAPTALELGIVLEARAPTAVDITRRLLRASRVEVVPFDATLQERALVAWRRFGKGRHRAALNYGDCMTYALAEEVNAPILCTGQDFALTDLPVLSPPAPAPARPEADVGSRRVSRGRSG